MVGSGVRRCHRGRAVAVHVTHAGVHHGWHSVALRPAQCGIAPAGQPLMTYPAANNAGRVPLPPLSEEVILEELWLLMPVLHRTFD